VTALETALRQICTDLTTAGHSFALVGGLAVSARTEPRFTRDADIAVAVASDVEAERLVRTLRARDYEIDALVEQEAVGRLATAAPCRRCDDGSFDRPEGSRARRVTRPQDIADLRALLRVASDTDVDWARAALTLIAQRGYHRGRDLEAAFEQLLRRQ
jgi:hypothetical protein